MTPLDDVRARALKRRNALSREERIQYSRRICERVQPLLHGIVALYRAVGSEADLSYLDKSGLHLCLPACSNADMRFYHIDESTEYRKSRFGIWEPVHALPAEASQLDIVLVPLVAFDEACNRMGHGCGYYDRYLPACRATTIGIAFECQKDILQLHAHDVPLDMIVSEQQMYRRT
ncbi:5-formyltetrahydrofolate cyclo-ligase [[Clostridium] innocuum]|nr:5-formyltetrahydrofolate cyclo-ligase [[Clostridium] innocuum]MCR0558783.1 5-formyltetrahydrofolate cyclo-ligase [[Clostridium] innocuum]